MMHAYDKNYLSCAQKVLERSFDYAVYDLGLELEFYYGLFLCSSYSKRFERGDFQVLAGMSGIELAQRMLRSVYKSPSRYDKDFPPANNNPNYSQQYWAGWALAYYQWYVGFSFRKIDSFISINEICDMYYPYHEMDLSHFVENLNELYLERMPEIELKRRRVELGLSQKELAQNSGVPLRSIQQYEQRQKDINKASFSRIVALARALHYENPLELYERIKPSKH